MLVITSFNPVTTPIFSQDDSRDFEDLGVSTNTNNFYILDSPCLTDKLGIEKEISLSLAESMVEDAYTHPLEAIIENFVDSYGEIATIYIQGLFLKEHLP